jgi:hypothetical protein
VSRRDLSWAGTSTTVGAKRRKSVLTSIEVRRVFPPPGRTGRAVCLVVRLSDGEVLYTSKPSADRSLAAAAAARFLRSRPILEDVTPAGCQELDPEMDRRCALPFGHDGPHKHEEDA